MKLDRRPQRGTRVLRRGGHKGYCHMKVESGLHGMGEQEEGNVRGGTERNNNTFCLEKNVIIIYNPLKANRIKQKSPSTIDRMELPEQPPWVNQSFQQ